MKILKPIYRCIATEKVANRWFNGLGQSVSTTGVHYAHVDAIQLFTIDKKYFSLTGARDRQIVLWDLSTAIHVSITILNNNIILYKDMPNWACVPVEKAHDGWVWSISCPGYNSDTFFSAGWDSTVKKWQVTEASIRVS
jgi:WD40 repeat protein